MPDQNVLTFEKNESERVASPLPTSRVWMCVEEGEHPETGMLVIGVPAEKFATDPRLIEATADEGVRHRYDDMGQAAVRVEVALPSEAVIEQFATYSSANTNAQPIARSA